MPGGAIDRDWLFVVLTQRPLARAQGQAQVVGDSDAALIGESLIEPARFAGIFDRHADAILRYASARLGPEHAEDVTAETFLAAFRRRGSYDTSYADARPWLYGIAVRRHQPSECGPGEYRWLRSTRSR